jgi:hypothetical protein
MKTRPPQMARPSKATKTMNTTKWMQTMTRKTTTTTTTMMMMMTMTTTTSLNLHQREVVGRVSQAWPTRWQRTALLWLLDRWLRCRCPAIRSVYHCRILPIFYRRHHRLPLISSATCCDPIDSLNQLHLYCVAHSVSRYCYLYLSVVCICVCVCVCVYVWTCNIVGRYFGIAAVVAQITNTRAVLLPTSTTLQGVLLD